MEEHAVAATEHAATPQLPVLGPFDLNDPAFWAFIGLLIFIGVIVYMKVPRTITKTLDDRATKITSELAAAETLRKEAETKLAEVQKRAAEAEVEAAGIIAAARREADQLAASAQAALAERIASREKIAEERIARAESDAIRDVKMAAVQTASKAAAVILSEQLVGKAADAEFAKGMRGIMRGQTTTGWG
jgi:F-type H+-transporting ATPase subunit b